MRKYSLSAALRHRWYATWRTFTLGGSASLAEKHNIKHECHSPFFSLTRRKYKYSHSGMRKSPSKNWHSEHLNYLSCCHAIDVTIFFVAHKCRASLWLLQKGVKRGLKSSWPVCFVKSGSEISFCSLTEKNCTTFCVVRAPEGEKGSKFILQEKSHRFAMPTHSSRLGQLKRLGWAKWQMEFDFAHQTKMLGILLLLTSTLG